MKLPDLVKRIPKPAKDCHLLVWLAECDFSVITKILRHNFLRELAFENIPADELADIARGFEEHLEKRLGAGESGSNPWTVFIEYAGKDARCHLPGGGIDSEQIADCVRVIRLTDLQVYNVNNGDGYIDEMTGQPITLDRLWESICQGTLDSSKLSGQVGGSVLLWVTKAESMITLRDETDQASIADKVSDALGLNYPAGKRIVGLRLPRTLIHGLCTSTMFDPPWSPLFRPAKKPDRWGRAVDLRDYDEGLSEAVGEKMDWNPSISILPLGEVAFRRRIGSEELEKLYKMSCSQFDESSVTDP